MHKLLFYNKFIICLYMFRALCAHHQEFKIVLYSIWYHPLSKKVVFIQLLKLYGVYLLTLIVESTEIHFVK